MRDPRFGALKRACFIGNHTPRQCGIATFTADVANAVRMNGVPTDVVAINDRAKGYDYPAEVTYQILEKRQASYRAAADYLNINDYNVVCLQHEYGIFGGPAGSHVLGLLRNLRMPIVTTFHTLLEEPSEEQARVLEEIIQLSQRAIVMSRKGREILQNQFGVETSRIDIIPHGAPNVPLVCPNDVKGQVGLDGKKVLLTFGLLSPDKGIEYVIQALPKLVKKEPNLVYVFLGATHPQVRAQTNDAYRKSLYSLAKELGVEGHVRFEDRYVELDELIRYLQAADIYITPYLKPQQITSGTLSYAFACGKPIVSTPYWHAAELLADDRGRLVPFRDSAAIEEAVGELVEDRKSLLALSETAYAASRQTTWENVGVAYLESFERAMEDNRHTLRTFLPISGKVHAPTDPLRIDLRHLSTLTDDTGIMQHAVGPIPNRNEGYCVDDNGRALVICSRLMRLGAYTSSLDRMATTYLSYLHHCFNSDTKRFRNFMSYDRRWLEEAGSEDSHGRAIWGLGEWVAGGGSFQSKSIALDVLEQAIPTVHGFTSPRAWAYSILGMCQDRSPLAGESMTRHVMHDLADRLLRLYRTNRTQGWHWFEEYATYDNARISQAMIAAGLAFDNASYVQTGLDSLRWLCDEQVGTGGHFSPIGCSQVWWRGRPKPGFDQQPLEAWSMADACLLAATLEDTDGWKDRARWAIDWFVGKNDRMLPIVDTTTGGCCDGLQIDRVNENQGAESTLAYLGAVSGYLHFVTEDNWKIAGINQ